jgi:predicted enzyme related to lactoylglutathione lyase
MATADILGQFVWHDLMTTDQGAAAAFYPKVTGWKSQPWENDSSYSIWVTPKGMSGGTMLLPAEAQSAGTPAHWLPYVGTPDIESTVEDAEGLGAKVLKPVTDIPSVGKYAVLQDPQGATFAVYTPEQEKEDGEQTGGGFSWHELATTDLDAAWEFYSELFGWDKEAEHNMGEMGTYLLFGQGGKQVGGMYKKGAEQPGGAGWLCYASVPSAADAAEAAKAAGGQVINGPMEVPGGDWIAQVLDPQGAAFAVHEVKKAAGKAKKPKTAKAKPAEPAAAAVMDGFDAEAAVMAEPEKTSARAKKAPSKKKAASSKAAAKKAPAKSKAAAKSKGKPAAKKAASKKAAKKAVKKGAAVKKSAAPKKKAAAKKTKVAAKKAASKKAARKK